MGVVPIVNENDTISVSEIKFGDNDTLSAIAAGMVNADYLFLMTDVDCLYTDNPMTNPNAKPVEVVEDVNALRDKVTLPLHTRFLAKDNPMLDRKWWILHGLHSVGTIFIDEGAVRAIAKVGQKSSLFAAGIVKIEGYFVAHQAVDLKIERTVKHDDINDVEVVMIGKGLVNYSSAEISRIKGCQSSDIEQILGYADSECVIHRDNLVITTKSDN
ncbi:12716_t:CDS:2 [Racocetra fulgida]|uniref:12716_t:CDS:1 n=1 Tax=Racocetra fulgida TaxID=60492 RepID=A0A9N8VN76_9GLOM|nr:12716_t:CDS:2 [Racocetra fulgida]